MFCSYGKLSPLTSLNPKSVFPHSSPGLLFACVISTVISCHQEQSWVLGSIHPNQFAFQISLFLGSTSQSRLVAQHGSFLTAPSVSKAVQASLPVNQRSIYPTSILTVTNIAQALITQFWTSAVSSCLVSQLHSPVQLTWRCLIAQHGYSA